MAIDRVARVRPLPKTPVANGPLDAAAVRRLLSLAMLLAAALVLGMPASAQEAAEPAEAAEAQPVQEEVAATPVSLDPPPAPAPSALAQFTTAVEDREPIDQITFVENDVRKVFFFSDLRGLDGQTVIHRWLYGGEVKAEVAFEVRGPRWRVWSSKELLEDWIGDWTVEIVDGAGEVIAAETFTYSAPGA